MLPLKSISKILAHILLFSPLVTLSQNQYGAAIPWTTYEAENMHTNGKILGPIYTPYHVETESSGQKCVMLNSDKQYIEFKSSVVANTMVVRYSLPVAANGDGLQSSLSVYINGKFIAHNIISSQETMLYGKYPFTNNPADGEARNFYNELRIKNIAIFQNDTIKIEWDNKNDNAKYCILDLVDLENVKPPLAMPENAVSLTDKRFTVSNNDYTEALRQCISYASKTNKTVWIPEGNYKITGDILLPKGITIQGAGIWYSTFTGDTLLYKNENNRVRFIGNGDSIHLSDFAIIGALNYRNDNEANDGIVGSYGINSSIKNLWIEHTKVGMWIENSSHLLVENCRMRNTIADGINFCVGMNNSIIKNCTTRNTGDDCFAIWPTTFKPQLFQPGENIIINCTGELPFLANGAAIYGGKSNVVKNCVFKDIYAGSAILISTTFPTQNDSINNKFSGTTLVENCNIQTSGGFDHEWGWRGAIEICLDKHDIAGIRLENINIDKSLSNAVSIIAKTQYNQPTELSDASFKNINVLDYGIGIKRKYGLYISSLNHGDLIIEKSTMGKIKNESKNFRIISNP